MVRLVLYVMDRLVEWVCICMVTSSALFHSVIIGHINMGFTDVITDIRLIRVYLYGTHSNDHIVGDDAIGMKTRICQKGKGSNIRISSFWRELG